MRQVTITEGTAIRVRKQYISPVPTAYELKLLLDYLEDYSPIKVALGIIMVCGLRPAEVCHLKWHNLKLDKDGNVAELIHLSYKPKRRVRGDKSSLLYKELKKPVFAWSKWLNDQIIGYAKIASPYENDQMFPFRDRTSLDNPLTEIRKLARKGLLPPEYGCFLDPVSETVVGAPFTQMRISVYSLRRWCFTFHFFNTFNGDAVALAHVMGHTRVSTSMEHYVQPKESIGLTNRMIKEQVQLDQLIHAGGKKQRLVWDYCKEWQRKFTPRGQTTILAYPS